MDSLRAVAVLGVLFGHVGSVSRTTQTHDYGAFIANLTGGVCLFFVLSGFLLYRPFFNAQFRDGQRPRVVDFTRRRILRIVPAYWLALTVLAIYPGLVGRRPREVALLRARGRRPDAALSGRPVAWSLCIEASFYVMLPFFAIGMARMTRRRGPSAQVRLQLGSCSPCSPPRP